MTIVDQHLRALAAAGLPRDDLVDRSATVVTLNGAEVAVANAALVPPAPLSVEAGRGVVVVEHESARDRSERGRVVMEIADQRVRTLAAAGLARDDVVDCPATVVTLNGAEVAVTDAALVGSTPLSSETANGVAAVDHGSAPAGPNLAGSR